MILSNAKLSYIPYFISSMLQRTFWYRLTWSLSEDAPLHRVRTTLRGFTTKKININFWEFVNHIESSQNAFIARLIRRYWWRVLIIAWGYRRVFSLMFITAAEVCVQKKCPPQHGRDMVLFTLYYKPLANTPNQSIPKIIIASSPPAWVYREPPFTL